MMCCTQCSCRCFWLSVVAGYATTTVLWTAVLLVARYLVIDWKKRSMLATCYDPDEPEWGKPPDIGIPQKFLDYGDFDGRDDGTAWNRCHLYIGNGLCTPWGYSCGTISWEPLSILCPLEYGGDGDGCRPPTSIFGETLPDMYGRHGVQVDDFGWHFGYIDNPLFPEQNAVQNFILLCLSPLVCALLGFFVIAPQRCRCRRFQAVAGGEEEESVETELSNFQDGTKDGEYSGSTTDDTISTKATYHDKERDAV